MNEGPLRYKKPTVKINGRPITVVHGNPWEPEFIKNVDPVVVPPGAQVRINFIDRTRADQILVRQWYKGNEITKRLPEDRTFLLPQQEGTYVYKIEAKFSEVDESADVHTFVVNIQRS